MEQGILDKEQGIRTREQGIHHLVQGIAHWFGRRIVACPPPSGPPLKLEFGAVCVDGPAEVISDRRPEHQRWARWFLVSVVCIHDLSHSFASTAVAAGQGLPMIGKLLAHSQVQTTTRYAHLAADPVKTAADAVSPNIARHLNGDVA